ncbi:chloramphenicol phosphotransferase CPT family protein [Peribacillus sp. SCS-37]|uniref:chloramphenicol phosphotransferase CPT family protein n=1 Tax=Paraperibacillus esterisolvens TaxID=3115296 RepID=UPI0039064A00
MNRGSIILLNGTSSSGKSALARELITLLPDFFHFSIDGFDTFIERMEDRPGNRLIPVDTEVFYHRTAAMFSDQGVNIILDEVLHNNAVKADFRSTLDSFPIFYAGLHCPLKELARREEERGDRRTGLAAEQFPHIHKDLRYDIEVDTEKSTPEDCALEIYKAYTQTVTKTAIRG